MKVAVIGATSAIAQETARCYAAEGASFFLCGRDTEKLAAVAADLTARGAAAVDTLAADLADRPSHPSIVAAAGHPGVVLVAHGTLPDQLSIEPDPAAQVKAFDLNATSVISITASFANVLRPGASIAVIGSVAGDRGRRSNYVYGAAKAALHAYCEGLRARLALQEVNVVLVKPGWVDTPMTSHMRRNPLFVSAAAAGRRIHRAIERREGTVYVPWFWRWISIVVRVLPAPLLKF